MSSDTVVKAVAKKLKYYFEVKRLEDGFDLSDVNAPLLDHPPLRSRPTLQYNGLHDRPLKHYFSQPEVRVQLTQLGLKDAQLQNPRERHIKKSLTKTMRKQQYLKSTIPDNYYVYTPAGMKIHPSMVGFGASPKCQRKKTLKGGWPVMRSAPPVNISRGEAERLVNSATRLLAATTEWDLVHKQDPTFSVHVIDADSSQSKRPRTTSGKRRPLTAKYTWDLHGHRVPSAKVKAYDDSYLDKVPRRTFLRHRRSPSPSSSTTTEGESTKLPPRPPSPSPPPPKPPSPPPAVERPSSRHRQRTIINMPTEKIRDEVKVTKRSPRKYEMGSQTDRHLLDEYDHNEEEVKGGPWGEYQIYVRTGDRIGASTSADVNVTIYGEKGRTPAIPLSTSKHNKIKFQRGKEDLFIVAAHHVGKMRKIKIGHDRHQLSYAWYLESVMVYDMNDKQIYDFPCERWLSGQDDDQRTYRVLPVDRQRAFVDALEKADSGKKPKRRKSRSSDSESSSETEYESSSQKKDKASMRPKRSQRSRDRSSDSSSSSTCESETESDEDGAVVRMSAPSTPKEQQPKPEENKEVEQKPLSTVIQFKKKDSQKVEEEVVLNGEKKDVKPDFLAGYKAGVEAVEASERKHKEDERARDRQLLSGSSIHDACRNGDLNRVRQLLDKFPEMKDFKDESGWTPLHLAAANGHVDIIKWLTSSGRDDIDVETPTGYTPMHVAAMNGHINAIMILNAMGADIGCKTVDKQSPLHLASRAGHLDCVKWLVANRASLTGEDSFGRTPLYLADEYGQTTVADFLRVCERDLADPNSTFAQMHRAQQRGGSVALPTIKEDDKTSTGSDQAQSGSASARSKDKEERLLKEKRQRYEEQQQHMEEQGVSFLDSIRRDMESEA